MPNVNIPETEKIIWTHQEKRRRQPIKKNDGHGSTGGGPDGDGLTTPGKI